MHVLSGAAAVRCRHQVWDVAAVRGPQEWRACCGQVTSMGCRCVQALQAIRVLGGRPFWLSCGAVAVALLCVLVILAAWRPGGRRGAGTAVDEPQGGDAAPRNGQRRDLAAAAAAVQAAAANGTAARGMNGAAASAAPQAAQSGGGEPPAAGEAAPAVADKRGASSAHARREEPAAAAPAPPQPAAAVLAPEEPADYAGNPASASAGLPALDVQHAQLPEAAARAQEAPAEAAVPFLLEAGWEGGMVAEPAPALPRAPATEPPGSPALSVRSSRLGSEAVRSHMVRIDSMQ